MDITILIPHYKVGKITAFCVSKLLANKGNHNISIIVIDNNAEDGSALYLQPFKKDITYIEYPKNKLQSHAIAFNYAIDNGYVKTPYFITMESDSYSVNDIWLDYYEKLIEENVDAAGSFLKLSGGLYMHPCGALYRTSIYNECKEYCDSIEYEYFPNMQRAGTFDYHTMIHKSVLDKVLENPMDYFELAEGYKPYSKEKALQRLEYYRPTCGVFHHGVGNLQESVLSYGERGWDTMYHDLPLNNKQKIIKRVGFEPGQFLYYWMIVNNKKVFSIPTEIKWMEGREGQQQEYTLTESGIKHLWGISSYTERGSAGVEDIYKLKRMLPDELYETLPEKQKVKI